LLGAIWLTTDLDAQLLHPADFQWTRNLVVASTFGLRLADAVHGSTPPFRDSYQTSSYLATRLAVGEPKAAEWWQKVQALKPDRQKALYEVLPPQVFEIGRGEAVSLSADASRSDLNWNWSDPPVSATAVGSGLALMALLLLVALNLLLPRSGWVILVLGLVVVSQGLVNLLAQVWGDAEPYLFTAGVSIWPSLHLRLLALMLALVFVVIALRRLAENWQSLDERYFRGPAAAESSGATLSEALWRLGARAPRLPPWAWLALASVLSLVTLMLLQRLMTLPLGTRLAVQLVLWVPVLALWWHITYSDRWPRLRVHTINEWVLTAPTGDPALLWKEYGALGAPRQRVLRTLTYLLLYLAFGSLVFSLLGFPASPCRGSGVCAVDGLLIGLCVIAMLFLLFLVVDAIQLSISWIQLMGRCGVKGVDRDSDPCRRSDDRGGEGADLPLEHCHGRMLIHLIGERTATVSRLIQYPLLIILLLLLARSTFFDDWGLPRALAVVALVNFAIALAAGIRLNAVARRVRSDILALLRSQQLALSAHRGGQGAEPSAAEVKELIAELEGLRIGAYVPFWEQPMVRAVLFLLGGLAITLSEYASLM